MFIHNSLLAGAAGLMGRLLDLVDFQTHHFFGPDIDVAAVSEIFDPPEHSQSSPSKAPCRRHPLHYNHDDTLSEGGSNTSSTSGPDEDTASLSASTLPTERTRSDEIKPMPSTLVWCNDLCMSEIYDRMEKGTLVKCLVLSQDNFERVAKKLYRRMERRQLTSMFESGSDLVSTTSFAKLKMCHLTHCGAGTSLWETEPTREGDAVYQNV